MGKHTDGMHHYHTRKRIYLRHEPFPHPDKWKNLMDKIIFGVGLFGPVMTLPQLLKIWFEKNASGVSVVSWSAYLVCAIFWLIYGIMHKEKPIIFTNVLWILLEVFIVIGTILYS